MLKSYYAVTDKGPYFNINQDAYYINLDHHIFGVIDGFGGTGIGDVVVSSFVSHVNDVFTKASHDKDATLKYYYDSRRSVECNFLINSLLSFHESLMQDNEQKSLYQRGGLNCLFVINNGERTSVISVGKIYALLLRAEKITKLVMEDDGLGVDISDHVATVGSWTKSAVGLFSPLQYYIKEFIVLPGDQLFIATEGAVNRVEMPFISQCFEEPVLKKALLEIFNQANFLGNRDNQTGILLRY